MSEVAAWRNLCQMDLVRQLDSSCDLHLLRYLTLSPQGKKNLQISISINDSFFAKSNRLDQTADR